jgi:MFS family permease
VYDTIGRVPASPTPQNAQQKRWVLTCAVLASTMAFVDESIVNVALPRMEADLHTSLSAMQWVINAYTLSMSALLLIGGAAGDRFGRRLIFMIGVSVFTLASITCGLAPNVVALIAARALQGVGAAFLIPCGLALISAVYDEKERGAAIGVWSGASAVAAGVAPILGGWIVDQSSWRAIFLINPILAIPTLWIAVRYLTESRETEAPGALDWRGALAIFLGLGAVVYGLIAAAAHGWSDPSVAGPVVAGTLLLCMFVWIEKHSAAPMMPLALFGSRQFAGVNLLTLLLYGALGGTFFFVPFLIIQVQGYSAAAAGAIFVPFALILGALSKWSGHLADHRGSCTAVVCDLEFGRALLVVPAAHGRSCARDGAHNLAVDDHCIKRRTRGPDRCRLRHQQCGSFGCKPAGHRGHGHSRAARARPGARCTSAARAAQRRGASRGRCGARRLRHAAPGAAARCRRAREPAADLQGFVRGNNSHRTACYGCACLRKRAHRRLDDRMNCPRTSRLDTRA